MDEASAEALAAGTGLSGWSPPAVLQPYVPHSAPLFKVFVMGPLTMLARRPSLRVPPPAADVTEAVGGALAIARVSAYVSEADTDAAGDGSNAAAAAADAADAATVAPDPPRWVLEALAARLRRELGLTLFNFDLIAVDTSRPRVGGCPVGASYLVIDINYFPGFEKLPDYEALMAEFLGWLFSEDGVATAGDDAAAEASARAPTPVEPAAAATAVAGASPPGDTKPTLAEMRQRLSKSYSQRPVREEGGDSDAGSRPL